MSRNFQILACPAQRLLSDSYGSEISWALKIMEECHNRFGISYFALCDHSEISRPLPGVKISGRDHKSGLTVGGTFRFMASYSLSSIAAAKQTHFDIVHHMFPFGFGLGFNPLAVLGHTKEIPFVVGPIQYPQTFVHHSDYQISSSLDDGLASVRLRVDTVTVRVLRRILRRLNEKTLRAADVLVFDGESTRRLYCAMSPAVEEACSHAIPMGVDTDLFTPKRVWSERPLEIMIAGYFTKRKGLDILIRALPTILESYPDLRLRLCGEGPATADAKLLVSRAQLGQSVIFQGHVARTDLPGYYSSSRLYLQPSLSESLPSAILESLACGTPVIASEVGLLPEYFRGISAVTLVRPGDHEVLAEAVVRNLEGGGTESSLVARHVAETSFSWPLIADRWARAYEDAVSNH